LGKEEENEGNFLKGKVNFEGINRSGEFYDFRKRVELMECVIVCEYVVFMGRKVLDSIFGVQILWIETKGGTR
jgi:hypothetical protein